MSEATITVSDGEDFFQIPLSDLPEAAADGFYVPALRGRTIVTDGEELFEIPNEDLAEAAADGFRDALAGEAELLDEARELLAASGDVAVGQMEGEESALDESPEPVHAAAATVVAGDTLGPGDTVAVTASRSSRAKADAAGAAGTDDSDGSESGVEDSSELPEGEEPEGDGSVISKFLLPGGNLAGGKTWQVMLMNAALHALIIGILAAIILPAPDTEILMEITSAFEPKDPVKMEFEPVELEQPDKLESDPVEMEVVNQFEVENENNVEIDVNDMELNIPETLQVTEAPTGAQSNSKTGEMSGRSSAGRAAAVSRRGGNAASEAAVTAGLQWLAMHQYPDGGWSYNHALGECKGQCSQPGSLSADCRNAATGMALLAMLGAGNTAYDGAFQESVLKGTGFLLQNSAAVPAGLDLRSQHAGNTGMYTQAIAATALCEVLAMTQHNYDRAKSNKELRSNNRNRVALIRQLRPAAQAGINFIVNAQHQPSGGWGYDPGKAGDTSILGWQVMALKSAVHAKIAVPVNTVAAANRFLTSVQTPDGWFGYRSPDKRPSTTAIGIIARMLSGMSRENPILKMGVNHLSARGPDLKNMYYNYYATQVMLHYGGEKWQKWNAVMRDHLVNTQIKEGHAAGSWNIADAHGGRAGRLYMTCLCTMTLEVYYRHLPLYGEPEAAKAEMAADDAKSD